MIPLKTDPSSGSHPDSRLGGLCVNVSDVDWYLHLCCWMFILHKAAAQRDSVHAVSRSRSLSWALTLSHHPVTRTTAALPCHSFQTVFHILTTLILKPSYLMAVYLFNHFKHLKFWSTEQLTQYYFILIHITRRIHQNVKVWYDISHRLLWKCPFFNITDLT